jgi:hypothetical protein
MPAIIKDEVVYGGGSSNIELDTTLSIEGKAADAKAVGDTKISYTDVVNNLESTATDLPLSANQGRVLNEKFESIEVVKLTNYTTLSRYGKFRELRIEGETMNETAQYFTDFTIPEQDRPPTGIRFYGKDNVHGNCEFFVFDNGDGIYKFVSGVYTPNGSPSNVVSASGPCYARTYWLVY